MPIATSKGIVKIILSKAKVIWKEKSEEGATSTIHLHKAVGAAMMTVESTVVAVVEQEHLDHRTLCHTTSNDFGRRCCNQASTNCGIK